MLTPYVDPGGELGPAGWAIGLPWPPSAYDERVRDARQMVETGGWPAVDTGGLELVAVAVDERNGRRHPDLLATLRHPLIRDGDRVRRDSLGGNESEPGQLWLWGVESTAYQPELRPIRRLSTTSEDGPGMRLHHASSRECDDPDAVREYLLAGLLIFLRWPVWARHGHRPVALTYYPRTANDAAAYQVVFARDDGDHILKVRLQEPDGRGMAAADALDDFQHNLPLMLSGGFLADLPRRL